MNQAIACAVKPPPCRAAIDADIFGAVVLECGTVYFLYVLARGRKLVLGAFAIVDCDDLYLRHARDGDRF